MLIWYNTTPHSLSLNNNQTQQLICRCGTKVSCSEIWTRQIYSRGRYDHELHRCHYICCKNQLLLRLYYTSRKWKMGGTWHQIPYCIELDCESVTTTQALHHLPVNNWRVMLHYSDVIMGAMAYQIIRLTVVYSIVYSSANHRKHQKSASEFTHKGPVTRTMFPFDDMHLHAVVCCMKYCLRNNWNHILTLRCNTERPRWDTKWY